MATLKILTVLVGSFILYTEAAYPSQPYLRSQSYNQIQAPQYYHRSAVNHVAGVGSSRYYHNSDGRGGNYQGSAYNNGGVAGGGFQYQGGTQYQGDSKLLEIIIPREVYDFKYRPTRQGYYFSYALDDGFTHSENAIIPNAELLAMGRYDKNNRTPPAPRGKSRKLSPGLLKSAAG